MSSSSSSDMNFMDLLFSREDAFLKDVVKDEPFVDHNYTDDAITVSVSNARSQPALSMTRITLSWINVELSYNNLRYFRRKLLPIVVPFKILFRTKNQFLWPSSVKLTKYRLFVVFLSHRTDFLISSRFNLVTRNLLDF